ncbi:2-keto-4-pentenoate hydratase/2-oxohepta-3-ene-1,7-dioic acid hydratase (catechol pathway) [Duganella sp. CF402]|uniref:fumarylacetoacetate hydrolase family protein n=1 Tax=unclassified Duganella TaxID=2636909 RepID=UPI0008D6C503|nr:MULTISPECIES: fumarylacetoacetate hydrolase family protein [unclassified Duganella]RZT09293.1 2-keto-4-pentenoate hydratase/2-oxohepta-3-ene-1,7-dioic acid hydratase in catechol pathway [Duganella sp. BK701]SEL62918.1 2-keto-4-pentenoate hydratase/2-oxohepta-3-ene-1,7-dioic acid hydratase (catechol pathway) [Duganella sp. CF402]
MKFTTFRSGATTRLGVLDQGSVIDINRVLPQVPPDLRAALLAGIDLTAAARVAVAQATAADRTQLSDVVVAPLVPSPGKTICLGLNYYDHAAESGREKPVYPWFFLRCDTSLLAHGEAALLPKVSERFDYEAELAVVIGTRARHVTQEQALQHVFGYTCFNDMSVRDYQKRTPQWTIGKNFDRTGGFGPQLVTADELAPGAEGLRIQARLNGQVMQDANTTDMIWNVAETIALLSECVTLEPGDVIVMGTPAGVGQSRTPPVWMKHGDKIEIEIENVGLLVNTIEQEV